MKCPRCQTEQSQPANFCGKCGADLSSKPEDIKSYTKTLITRRDGFSIGSTIADRFHIIESLGKGGMGKVFKALDSKVEEKVALKVLHPEISADKNALERFRNEVKIARNISHRNICRLYDLGEDQDLIYISMEYISGEDLKTLIRRIGELSPGKAVFIVRQVCEGLVEAHRQGVIHRDLKPQNIMIDKEGNARIMDFGIARSIRSKGITEAGVIMGTPEYMSPEQVEGKELDQRTDIYSLGVIFYEMLTGRTPFSGDTPITVAVKQKTEIPEDPRKYNSQIPEEISRVILTCLKKDRNLRYQKTQDLLNELKRIEKKLPATDRVLPERKTRSGEITVKFNLRKHLIPVLGALSFIILGFLIFKMLTGKGEALLASGKPAMAVMHFENNTGDSTLDHWKKALSDLLISDLSQSKYLEVLSGERLYDILDELELIQAPSLSSRDLNAVSSRGGIKYALIGKMTKAGSIIRLNTSLIEVESGYLIGSAQVEGEGEDSLFNLVDQLTTKIKQDFQISSQKIEGDIDAKIEDITSTSTEAIQYYQEGMNYQNKADYSKSIPLMELAVAIDPDFAMAYRTLSIAYANLGLHNEARKHLQTAYDLREKVSERERFYIEGDYFRNSERTLDKAVLAYKGLLDLYPEDQIGHNNLGILYVGLEKWDEAKKHFEANLHSNSRSYFTYVNLANVYLSQGQNAQAKAILEEYLARIAEHSNIRGNLALTHLNTRNFEQAMADADRAFAEDQNYYQYFYIRGLVFLAQKKWDRARAEFLKLLDTEQPSAHYLGRVVLATFNFSIGNTAEALNQIQQGMELAEMFGEDSWSHQFSMMESLIHLKAGNMEAALKACDRTMQIAEKTQGVWQMKQAFFCRGLVNLEMNDVKTAQEVVRSLGQLVKEGFNPNDIRFAHYLEGRILVKQGRFSEAIRKYDQSLELMTPKDSVRFMVLDSQANALFEAGDMQAARVAYEKIADPAVLDLDNSYYFIRSHYMLGKILQSQGLNREAKQFYQSFLRFWSKAQKNLPEIRDARLQIEGL